MATSINKLLLTVSWLCLTLPALAIESLPDPTKPAVDIPNASETGEGVEKNSAPIPKKQGLQSVIISSQHRAAVINGETVALGGKFGDATLVEVRPDSVVLQGVQGRRVMELFPEVHFTKAEAPVHEKLKVPTIEKKKVTHSKTGNANRKEPGPVNSEQVKDKRESL